MIQQEKIRNVALISHGGAGKTTLSEAILFNTGEVDRLGRVDNGQAMLDYDPEEVKRKISINASLANLKWKDYKINLLDTPGYFDFVGEVLSSLRVVDACIVVVDAVAGLEVGTELVWGYADEQSLPRIVFVNKMDKEHADFYKTTEKLNEEGLKVTPFQLPIGSAQSFVGIVDLIKLKAYKYKDGKAEAGEIPAEMLSQVNSYRERLIEAAAEADEQLTEKYLEGMDLSEEEISRGLTQGVKNGLIVPIICGSAYQNIAIPHILDIIVNLLPSPIERGSITGTLPDSSEEKAINPSPSSACSALVFKVITDPYIGEMTLLRVYSGSISPGALVYNPTRNIKEKVSHISFVKGKNRVDVPQIGCGDIGALIKFKGALAGETLCDPENSIILKPINFPEAAISTSVNPKTKADQEKMSLALHRLHDEDPTFTIYYDHELGQTIISGMGEVHIDVMISRLQKKFGVEVEMEKPKVPYRETIRVGAKGEGKYKRQTGGRGQYGHALIEISPLPRNSEETFIFENNIFGGAVPAKYIPPIEKGIKDTMSKGILAGYHVLWVKINLYDGSFHEVDSSDMAFQIAGSFAIKDAFKKANPILLEPILEVQVTVPEENMGDVIGDLNSRRGKIQGMEPLGKHQELIKAYVPQAEMYKYATTLRSITRGRGVHHLSFSHYEEIPSLIAEKIIAAAAAAKEEEVG